ncbi:forkhead box protein Q1-like [Asterias rubens]|uniref:forkhead box protein Q1-like n=1 Tax=Asterias rubens TaxID=7604 RepID=UPI001454F232|nr:forkhead box protein Q1-like [Asterias rubens]
MASASTGCSGGKSRPKSRRPNYQRRVKPELSYAELIAVAIKSSPEGMLTLRGIQSHMSSHYECFRGTYVGWKNSVRHNLSVSDCFVKVLKNEGKPNAKDNFWKLNAECSHYQLHQSCPLTRKINTKVPYSSPCISSTRKIHGRKGNCNGTAVPSSTPQYNRKSPPPNRKSSPATPLSVTSSADEQASSILTPSQRESNGVNSSTNPSFVSLAWPSLQPSVNPPVGHRDQPIDEEWELLNDLFVPDSAIDISLYNENGRHQAESFHHDQAKTYQDINEQKAPSSRGGHSLQFADNIVPKMEFQSSYYDVGALQRKLRIKSEHATARRHHPYQIFGSFRRYEHCSYQRHQSTEAKGSDDSQRVPSSSFGNHYMVASAIRTSLGLDLDEMALFAIEDSVRILDMSRPCDFMSA